MAAVSPHSARRDETRQDGRMGSEDQLFGDAWAALPLAGRACLLGAFDSLAAGGLPVGSAVADPSGAVVASGRNRAYDPPGGHDPLQGTPLAHAEMNALAGVPTARDLAGDTLWSSQQPCAMCDAAAVFCGVGAIRWLAPDPWAVAADVPDERGPDAVRRTAPADHRWLVVANALFVAGVVRARGRAHPTPVRNAEREPETDRLVDAIAAADDATLPGLLARLWPAVVAAATDRSARTSGTG
jgi:tRNA(Arg) A34 adenosine deaminase TadA